MMTLILTSLVNIVFVIDQYSWEIPEGGGEEGVDPLESAKENYVRKQIGGRRMDKLVDLHLSNSVSDEAGVIYMARKLRQKEAAPEDMNN
jgi:hypothetical protein